MSAKRQLTIGEMFGGGGSSPTKAKRARIDDEADASTSKSSEGQASTSTSTQAAPAVAFSRASWLESLSKKEGDKGGPSTRQLLQLEHDTLEESWLSLLHPELKKSYFLDLKKFLWNEGVKGLDDSAKGKVFPPAGDIYAWSRDTPLNKVKVVIIGQDPYHDDEQAHGLCFSVKPGVKIPPSLRNIYSEIKKEYPAFEVPKHGNLSSWATSGVLLLNTSLTVKAHQAGSHSNKGWETFTDRVVALVDRYGGAERAGQIGRGVVFLAWGAWAAKRVAKLDKNKHLILKSAHPSPLSAHKGFLGNGHFKQANDWLEKRYGASGTVEWTKLDIAPSVPEAKVDES